LAWPEVRIRGRRGAISSRIVAMPLDSCRPRLILDPPVRTPDQMPPAPRRVATRKRLRPDLIDVVTARRLAPADPPGALEGIGVADPASAGADSEHGPSAG